MKLKEIFPQETKDHLDQKSLQSGANLRTSGGGDKDGSINIFCKFCIFCIFCIFYKLSIFWASNIPHQPPRAPECPICMDEMTSPTRIFNCFNGHICEGCKQKLKQPVYPKCRTNIIGRATDIENYLTICTFSQMFVPISIYIPLLHRPPYLRGIQL